MVSHSALAPRKFIGVVALLSLLTNHRESAAGISVSTSDGRTLVGEVDSRSDDRVLWVRHDEEHIVLSTAIPWRFVTSASLDGQAINPQQLSEQVTSLKAQGPEAFLTTYVTVLNPDIEINPSIGRFPLEQFNVIPPPIPRVASLEIDAALVNIDPTVEPDAVAVVVTPVDEFGIAVPVRGTLFARLMGERRDRHSGEVRFLELQRWNAALCVEDFHAGSATIPLRFQHPGPVRDLELCTTALLHVRVAAYSAGQFEASVPVALREFNPYRDNLQYHTGSRYFNDELIHAPRRTSP